MRRGEGAQTLDAALPSPRSESQRPQRRHEGKDAPMATTSSKHARVTRRTFSIRTSRRQWSATARRSIRDQASRGRQALHQGLSAGRPRLQRCVEGWPHRGAECRGRRRCDCPLFRDQGSRPDQNRDPPLHPMAKSTSMACQGLAFIKTLGLVKSNVVVADIVDMSFAKAAAAELGPYQGRCPAEVPQYQILWFR